MANFVFTYSAPNGTVEITEYKASTLVAPAQVWLEAVNHSGLAAFEESGTVYDGAHHEYYHEWTVNGEPLDPWDAPQNLAPGHNNPNKAFGKQVAFCFPEAGTYTVDLVVTDKDGNTAAASSSEFTVVAADSYYTDSNSIYVDPDADYTGVPAGVATANKVSTLEAARTRAIAIKAQNPRIRLRRGKSYDLHDYRTDSPTQHSGSFWISDSARVSRFDDFGDAEDPQPKLLGSRRPGRNLNAMIRFNDDILGTLPVAALVNLTFEGFWDSDVEKGAEHGPAVSLDLRIDGQFGMIYNCQASGTKFGFSLSTINGARAMLANSSITSWRDYGIFGGEDGSFHAILGCRSAQNPLARGGSAVSLLSPFQKNKDSMNAHGPFRMSRGEYIYVSQCDFFNSNNGWDGNGQPALRLLVDPRDGQWGYVERCCLEGGWQGLLLENSIPSQAVNPANIVVERNLLISANGQTSGKHISAWRTGVTIRDNVMIKPDVLPRAGGEPAVEFVAVATYEADNLTNPFVVYGNTYVALMSAANDRNQNWDFSGYDILDAQYITEENNVVHKPSMDTAPVTTFAPIDTSTAISGITPRYAGVGYNFQPSNLSLAGDVADSGTLALDYSLFDQLLMSGTNLGTTDQSYWSAIAATDTEHEIVVIDGDNLYKFYASEGHFTVSYDATEITITNTSGVTWLTGWILYVKLDRESLRPAFDTSYASPSTVPLPRPTTGSSAIDAATTGRVSPKDFLLTPRGATPSKGALEPA